ncbi:hypothetical protein CK203_039668 [Vitis vinifera]|uniref:Uncharacterized protein n=1 Tax=Vitis vinifera TaxID=29760 RepID=A0A438HFW6_VITVI|nr:hypothetical protein CK203_039668 [Vitis vinifera]
MFVSSGWNSLIWASREEGKRVADLVVDPAFWTGAIMVLKATIPLVRVLSWINGSDKPQMGYIYDTMDQAKEAIAKEFKDKKSQYMPFWEVIDEIWNKHLYSPLHSTDLHVQDVIGLQLDKYLWTEGAFAKEVPLTKELIFLQGFKSRLNADIVLEEIDPMDD